MKRDTTPKSASGKLLRHAGQAVTNEAVAAATPLVKSCCCCKNSSKCKGGGRHLLQFELECSIYKVGRYHSTEAIVILLKSVRIGGAHVLFSLALYVCNWYILQFLPPLKHNSQFTPALLISRPKLWIVMVPVWVSIAQSIWRILVRMQQTVQAAANR